MHLLIALKCPSSRSLFCLGFYLESCYNLCRAIRFLSSGCGRSGSVEQGKEPGVNRRRRGSGSGMGPTHPGEPGFSPGLSNSLLKQPEIMEQKKDKTGKKPRMEPRSDGNGAHSPAGLAGRVALGTGLEHILQLLLSNSVLSSASPLRPAQLGEHLGAGGEHGDPLGKGSVRVSIPERWGCRGRLSPAPVCAPLLSPAERFSSRLFLHAAG